MGEEEAAGVSATGGGVGFCCMLKRCSVIRSTSPFHTLRSLALASHRLMHARSASSETGVLVLEREGGANFQILPASDMLVAGLGARMGRDTLEAAALLQMSSEARFSRALGAAAEGPGPLIDRLEGIRRATGRTRSGVTDVCEIGEEQAGSSTTFLDEGMTTGGGISAASKGEDKDFVLRWRRIKVRCGLGAMRTGAKDEAAWTTSTDLE